MIITPDANMEIPEPQGDVGGAIQGEAHQAKSQSLEGYRIPKVSDKAKESQDGKQHRENKRKRTPLRGFSDQESDQESVRGSAQKGKPSGMSVSSESSEVESDSSSESDRSPQASTSGPRPKRRRDSSSDSSSESEPEGPGGRKRFGIGSKDKDRKWKLSEGQESYLSKQFGKLHSDKTLKKQILRDYPVPTHKVLQTHVLDPEILSLLDANAQNRARITDSSLKRMQEKMVHVFGPLATLWAHLEASVDGSEELPDPQDMLDLLEKVIVLLGQAHTVGTYERRLSVLAKFYKNADRARDILGQNKKILRKQRGKLFGPDFYDQLYAKTKRNLKSEKIKADAQAKGAGSKPRIKPLHKQKSHKSSRPFFKGSQQSRQGGSAGGHRQSSRGSFTQRGRGRGAPSRGYVCFNFTSGDTKRPRDPSFGGRAKHSHRKGGAKQSKDTLLQPLAVGERPYPPLLSRSGPKGVSSRRGSVRRKGTLLPAKLAKNHISHRGVRHGGRTSHRMAREASAAGAAPCAAVLAAGMLRHLTRGAGSHGERGNKAGRPGTRSIPQSYFPDEEKGRLFPPSVQPEKAQCIHQVRTLQDGECTNANEHDPETRLDVHHRSEGRILQCGNCRGGQEVSPVRVGEPTVRVPGPSLRPGISSSFIHKVDETSCFTAEKSRSEGTDILGRSGSPESGQGALRIGAKHHALAPPDVRLRDQLGEVCANPISADRISGISDRFGHDDFVLAEPQASEHSGKVSGAPKRGSGFSESASASRGQTVSNGSGSPTGTSALPSAADDQSARVAEEQSELRCLGYADTGMQGGVTLVDTVFGVFQWEEHNYAKPGPGYNHGCLQIRLGGRVQRTNSSRPVELEREQSPNQCSGASGSQLRCAGILKECYSETHPPEAGQQFSGGPDQQNGGPSVIRTVGGMQGPLGLLPGQTDHTYCRAPPGSGEYDSGSGESCVSRQQRLEVESRGIQAHQPEVRSSQTGPVCQQIERSAARVCQLEGRSTCNSTGRLSTGVGADRQLRLPSLLSNRQDSGQSKKGKGKLDPGHTSVAHSTMVRVTARSGGRGAGSAATAARPADLTARSAAPAIRTRVSDPSGLESVRQRYRKRGFSAGATKLLTKAWRPGTQAAYNGPWRKWVGWCNRQQVNPLQASVGNIVNFLSDMFDLGMEYSTLNRYRSALSAYHPRIEGSKVGKHPIVVQLLKGAFNDRPPMPRYTSSWDVNKVLKFVRKMGANEQMPMSDLSMKLACLMALTSVARGSELHKLDPQLMMEQDGMVEFKVAGLTKTKRPQAPHFSVRFTKYEKDVSLDVVTCLKVYLDRTQAWRLSSASKGHLFLSFIKPHKPVVACSIARWLKTVMAKSGIDTSIYKAHSTRMAATSKAKAQGLSTGQIVKRANWASASTFHKYYHRKVADQKPSQFGEAVLCCD